MICGSFFHQLEERVRAYASERRRYETGRAEQKKGGGSRRQPLQNEGNPAGAVEEQDYERDFAGKASDHSGGTGADLYQAWSDHVPPLGHSPEALLRRTDEAEF